MQTPGLARKVKRGIELKPGADKRAAEVKVPRSTCHFETGTVLRMLSPSKTIRGQRRDDACHRGAATASRPMRAPNELPFILDCLQPVSLTQEPGRVADCRCSSFSLRILCP